MSDFWVFAYGSLMWKPGFRHLEAHMARLDGAHRSLCVYSVNHRGTRKRPGLVLGLDVTGSCIGLAYRVPSADRRNVAAYLRAREMVTRVYRQAALEVALLDGSGRRVRALCFLADRRHRQYAGRLPVERQVAIVRRAQGRAGRNIDYVTLTAQRLRQLGVIDAGLERLMPRLGKPHWKTAKSTPFWDRGC
jgi:cation transport protein ChaC